MWKFRYVYLQFYLDQIKPPIEMKVTPSGFTEIQVGLFASRLPKRPNSIGLSIVEIKEIKGIDIIMSGIDVYNGTPLLDIKHYIRTLDRKDNANDGWGDDV